MKYLLLVGSAGPAAPQEMAVMNREIPGWAEEMERRGVLLAGRWSSRTRRPPCTCATARRW